MKGLFLTVILIIAAGCSRTSALLSEAENRIREGNYETALDIYRQVLERQPESAAGRRGYAMILSLKRISVFSALGILEKLYSETSDPALREDLIELSIDLGFYGRAENLLSPEHLNVEEFFQRKNILYRQALGCLRNPVPNQSEKKLQSESSDAGSYMMLRCMAAVDSSTTQQSEKPAGQDPARATEYLRILDSFRDPRMRCRAIRIIPEKAGIPPDAKEKAAECRKRYPEDFVIQREYPLILPGTKAAEPRIIFSDELRTAPYEGKLPEFPEGKSEDEKRKTE